MFLSHSKRSGFTLIELLVVIAIIGTLASTVLVSVQSARDTAWDARVKSDIKSIQTALELFRNATSTGAYPIHESASNLTISGLIHPHNSILPYLNPLPSQPQPAFSASSQYRYWRGSPTSYLLVIKFSRHPANTTINGTNFCYVKKGTHTYAWESTSPPLLPCPEIPSTE